MEMCNKKKKRSGEKRGWVGVTGGEGAPKDRRRRVTRGEHRGAQKEKNASRTASEAQSG